MARTFTCTVSGSGKVRLDKFLTTALADTSDAEGTAGGPRDTMPAGDPEPDDVLDTEFDAEGAHCAGQPCAQVAAISREGVKKAIARGLCRVNGTVCTTPSAKLAPGDTVELELVNEEGVLTPEEGDISIVHEDADVLVCAKPAGLTVHPCPSCPSGTLIQRLAFRYPELVHMGGLRPGIVHRLDKETSGLMVVARNEQARLFLTQAFAKRLVRKIYLAIVAGTAPQSGSCTMSIGRDPVHKTRMACVPLSQGGREARTSYERLWVADDGQTSLVRVHIHTGRTHQIRVHMAHLGHPLLGDATYAPYAVASRAPRVMLHAYALTVPHPAGTEPLSFLLPPPGDFLDCLMAASSVTQTLVITGNPGSGKSLVLKSLGRLGIPTISADELVRDYYRAGGEVTQWLLRRLGSDIVAMDGSVDRTVLMKVLGRSPDLRRELEELCHRLVLGDIRDFFARCQTQRLPLAAAEIPLYFECGWHKHVFTPQPVSLGIRAPMSIRRQRLASARKWSADKIDIIEQWQWEEEKKLAACDLVLDNTGRKAALVEGLEHSILPALEKLRTSISAERAHAFRELMSTPPPDSL